MIYHITVDILPLHMKCVVTSSKASHIHIQCGKFSKQFLMELRNDIQKQLYKLNKCICQQVIAVSHRVKFCFRHFIYHFISSFNIVLYHYWRNVSV